MKRTRILLGILALVSLAALFTTKVSRRMPDFEVYWTAGSRAIAAQPLYREEDGHYQFKYLPAFALLAAPLAMLPLPVAKALWFAVSALLMLVLLWLSVRALPAIHRPPALLLVATFVAMAKFYAHELVLGQVNLLFAVLVVRAIVSIDSGRETSAGILLALSVVVKPYGAIFAPWLATRRKGAAFVAMMVALALLVLLPAARYGWSGNLRLLAGWWHTVTATTPPNLTNPDNVSLGAMFARYLGPGSTATILAAVAALALLGGATIVMAGRGRLHAPEALEGALLLLLIPVLSPQGWDYVLLISTPAVMLLLDTLHLLPRGLRYATGTAIALVGLVIYDLVGRDFYRAFMRLSIITICVAIEAAALVTLRFRRVA
jgi:hypothetical protein